MYIPINRFLSLFVFVILSLVSDVSSCNVLLEFVTLCQEVFANSDGSEL